MTPLPGVIPQTDTRDGKKMTIVLEVGPRLEGAVTEYSTNAVFVSNLAVSPVICTLAPYRPYCRRDLGRPACML